MIQVDPDLFRNLLILFNWVMCSWDLYLKARQYVVTSRSPLPERLKNELDEKDVENARRYNLSILKLCAVRKLYLVVFNTWILYNEKLFYFSEYLNSLGYGPSTILVLIWMIPKFLNLPFHLYDTFVIEKRCKSNNQTVLFFFSDGIKNEIFDIIILPLVFGCSTIFLAFLCYISMENSTVWLWFSIMLTYIFYDVVYPKLQEMFYKYPSLPSGELKIEMENLASRYNYTIKQIIIKKYLGENTCGNLCLENDRIVMHEVLLKYNTEEVLSIFAHELGHWNLKHSKKKNYARQIYYFSICALHLCLNKYDPFYKALGFRESKRSIIECFAIIHFILTPATMFYNYFLNQILRETELEADNFVVQLDKGEPLKKAILHICKDCLQFPVCDNLYRKWFFHHSLLETRLDNIDSQINKLK